MKKASCVLCLWKLKVFLYKYEFVIKLYLQLHTHTITTITLPITKKIIYLITLVIKKCLEVLYFLVEKKKKKSINLRYLKRINYISIIYKKYTTPHTLSKIKTPLSTEVYINHFHSLIKKWVWKSVNDPSAGSPTETLLRLLLPLNDKVYLTSQKSIKFWQARITSLQSMRFTGTFNR